jgi:single-stranded-DNA-specific exonuclease
MKWNKNSIDTDLVREISARFNVDLLTASVFVRRNVTDFEELMFYLEDDLHITHNPFLFSEMEDAIGRISRAREEGEKVLIYGDRDVDGITSTVLLTEELRSMGIEVFWALPTGDETYGLSNEKIDLYAEQDVTLIVTVDCGVSNHVEINHAASLGIDTIVIDHHNPKEEVPNAFAIINPKMEDEVYPFRDLAGCAATAKVIWALRFSQTELYNVPITLLNIRPGNDSFLLEAVKLINLIETDRVFETIVPGMVNLEQTRLEHFFSNQIFVYDEQMQTQMLKQMFGPDIMVNLFDLAPELGSLYPALNGKSLLQIREISKLSKYLGSELGEIDMVKNIFSILVTQKNKLLSSDYEKILDLVALGTLADMMPLVNENRVLVRKGMEVINSAPRKGLRELVIRQNLMGKTMSTTDMAWHISPLINATGRMGVPDIAVSLFLEEDEAEREALAEKVVKKNRERKKMGDTAWGKILPKAKKSFDELEGKLVFIDDREINRGITGIIAAKLLKYFKTTALVVSHMDDIAFGSLRSTKSFKTKTFLEKCAPFFADYGGHDYAAGFNMDKQDVVPFYDRVKTIVEELVGPIVEEEEQIEIDAELPLSYLNPDLIKLVELFEPYGEQNPPLRFLCKGVALINADIIGKTEKQHLRLLFDTGAQKWPAVFWGAAEKLGAEFDIQDRVDIVFRLGKNYYQNNENLQLTILDIKK